MKIFCTPLEFPNRFHSFHSNFSRSFCHLPFPPLPNIYDNKISTKIISNTFSISASIISIPNFYFSNFFLRLESTAGLGWLTAQNSARGCQFEEEKDFYAFHSACNFSCLWQIFLDQTWNFSFNLILVEGRRGTSEKVNGEWPAAKSEFLGD